MKRYQLWAFNGKGEKNYMGRFFSQRQADKSGSNLVSKHGWITFKVVPVAVDRFHRIVAGVRS